MSQCLHGISPAHMCAFWEAGKPPWLKAATLRTISLPVIDDFALSMCGESCLIEYDEGGKPQWTQIAVDFVAVLNSANVDKEHDR